MNSSRLQNSFQRIFLAILLNTTILTGFLQAQTDLSDIKIIAHRGGTTERPENTMSAYKNAIGLGAEMCEIDIRTSKDGILFILHDAHLDRTTNGSGPAHALTMEELSQLDAGSWYDSVYSYERIPSFAEVLTWAKAANTELLLDLKESGQKYAERVSADILKFGTASNIVIGVRSVEQARAFRQLLPDSKQLGFIPSVEDIEPFAEAGVEVIRLWQHWLEKEPALTERVHKTRTKMMLNGSADGAEKLEELLKYSPDWILTDNPALGKK